MSDIDDTIKVSHVLSLLGKVSRASDITTPFAGMAPLYRLILNQNIQDSRIVYLSNAPKEIAGLAALEFSHKTFLGYNEFPPGTVALRENFSDKNHKINYIRMLLEEQKPDLVILIGDNGERDPEIYHQIYNEYSSRTRIISFIHQLYSTAEEPIFTPKFLSKVGAKIFKEQIGFATPIEIAVELRQQNLLDQKSYAWMIQNVAPYIIKEEKIKWDGLKPISFPHFKWCNDFVWKWEMTHELKPIYDKIMSSCYSK
ncbi:MAG: phosphatase domain-containing protein [Bdellovibrionota bacterium]